MKWNAKRKLAFALAIFFALSTTGRSDDTELFTTTVAPNVLIVFDNSGSMKTILLHDDYDPATTHPSFCGLNPNATYIIHQTGWYSVCGVLRWLYADESTSKWTRYPGNYLNWIWGVATSSQYNNLPQQTRLEAAKQTVVDVINATNPDDAGEPLGYQENVRFGLAIFENDGDGDPEGGYAIIEPGGLKSDLIAAVNGLDGVTWTPLAETLYMMGEYFAGGNGPAGLAVYDLDLNGNVTASPLASPIQYACQKNFIVIMTDGESTRDDFDTEFDGPGFSSFSGLIGDYDGDGWDPNNRDDDGDGIGGEDDGDCVREAGEDYVYCSEGTDYLNDIAKWLYDNDLRQDAGMDDTQNISTYTIGFTIDHPLLSETAANGGGLYFTADDPAELSESLQSALLDIITRSYAFTVASVPASRTTLDDKIYISYFEPLSTDPFWSGHLVSYGLDADGDIIDKNGSPATENGFLKSESEAPPHWEAGSVLQQATPSARNIQTDKSGAMVDFDTTNILAADLNVASDAERDDLVNFLTGYDAYDNDGDGDTNESRGANGDPVLGDIFHSSAVVIGAPSRTFTDEGFSDFRDSRSTRKKVIVAGANDGMLHGFNAGEHHGGDNPATPTFTEDGYYDDGTGAEVFGYIPGDLLDDLKALIDPTNQPPARSYFVDGSPRVADAWFYASAGDTTKSGSEWHTVLVAGQRQGGASYFALDVTDPSMSAGGPNAANYPEFLWRFADARLGETWSRPVLTRVKIDVDPGPGPPILTERWVAIFGGGYAEEGDPNSVNYGVDTDGDGATDDARGVFVVDLKTGDLIWDWFYDATENDGREFALYAFPSDPAVVDLDLDSYADVIFIGDLGGQMWKLDISDQDVDEWTGAPLFTAPVAGFDTTVPPDGVDDYFAYKSIYHAPAVALDDTGGLRVFFGTGDRSRPLNLEYSATNEDNDRFYALIDPSGPVATIGFGAPLTESDLDDISSLDEDPNPANSGFFLVGQENERFISESAVFYGVVYATSFLPDLSDPCLSGGYAFFYAFDFTLGTAKLNLDLTNDTTEEVLEASDRRKQAGLGIPSSPVVSTSSTGVRVYVTTTGGSYGSGTTGSFQVLGEEGLSSESMIEVIYWRELF